MATKIGQIYTMQNLDNPFLPPVYIKVLDRKLNNQGIMYIQYCFANHKHNQEFELMEFMKWSEEEAAIEKRYTLAVDVAKPQETINSDNTQNDSTSKKRYYSGIMQLDV